MIEHDLARALIGKDGSRIAAISDCLAWHLRFVGRGRIASFAISAVDIALRDIRCKREGRPSWKAAGGANATCKAYCGGIDRQFAIEKLLGNIRGYLDSGKNAVKITVGRKSLDEDIERVRDVRGFIVDDITLMVDANGSMNVDEAIRAAIAFRPYGIFWFEEPTLPGRLPRLRVDHGGDRHATGHGREPAHHRRVRLRVPAGEPLVHSTRCVQLRRHHRVVEGRRAVLPVGRTRVFPWHAETSREPGVLPPERWLARDRQLPDRPIHKAHAGDRKPSRGCTRLPRDRG